MKNTLCLAFYFCFNACFSQGVELSLKSSADYYFTRPVCTNNIKGLCMGPGAEYMSRMGARNENDGYKTLRSEDIAALGEAVCEHEAVYGSRDYDAITNYYTQGWLGMKDSYAIKPGEPFYNVTFSESILSQQTTNKYISEKLFTRSNVKFINDGLYELTNPQEYNGEKIKKENLIYFITSPLPESNKIIKVVFKDGDMPTAKKIKQCWQNIDMCQDVIYTARPNLYWHVNEDATDQDISRLLYAYTTFERHLFNIDPRNALDMKYTKYTVPDSHSSSKKTTSYLSSVTPLYEKFNWWTNSFTEYNKYTINNIKERYYGLEVIEDYKGYNLDYECKTHPTESFLFQRAENSIPSWTIGGYIYVETNKIENILKDKSTIEECKCITIGYFTEKIEDSCTTDNMTNYYMLVESGNVDLEPVGGKYKIEGLKPFNETYQKLFNKQVSKFKEENCLPPDPIISETINYLQWKHTYDYGPYFNSYTSQNTSRTKKYIIENIGYVNYFIVKRKYRQRMIFK